MPIGTQAFSAAAEQREGGGLPALRASQPPKTEATSHAWLREQQKKPRGLYTALSVAVLASI